MSPLDRRISQVRTVFALGLVDTARVITYRLQLKLGWFRRSLPIRPFLLPADGQSLLPVAGHASAGQPSASELRPADRPAAAGAMGGAPDDMASAGQPLTYDHFGYHRFPLSRPPDWFCNPFTGERLEATDTHWSQIGDFGNNIGDIKTVWELSRFGWLIRMAWQHREAVRAGELLSPALPMDRFVVDWCRRNPINAGVNWKCGQETSLRALHTLLAAQVLGTSDQQLGAPLLAFLEAHLRRVSPTVHYAMGQANNHGTSEAAALYVIGSVLAGTDDTAQQAYGRRCQRRGRYWLENRVARLFLADGTFSQYSVTYHRMVLDTLSLVECWRRRLGDSPFSEHYRLSVSRATRWLANLVDPATGDAPNLGPNDGAHILNFTATPYRDFRPSVQLAEQLFLGETRFSAHRHGLASLFDEEVRQASAPLPKAAAGEPCYAARRQGAVARLPGEHGQVVMRLPTYRFRPGHADALHVDLWHRGCNVLRDAGSYSYSADPREHEYFCSTACHNTVEFDERDQMPRLSRFLFGHWLRPDTMQLDTQDELMASYTDYAGASHRRRIRRTPRGWEIVDEVSGFATQAVLRWRLPPGQWSLKGGRVQHEGMALQVRASVPVQVALKKSTESRFYLQKRPVPSLEANIGQSGVLTTTIELT